MDNLFLFHESFLKKNLPKINSLFVQSEESEFAALEVARLIAKVFVFYFRYYTSIMPEVEQIHCMNLDGDLKIFLIKREFSNGVVRVSKTQVESDPLKKLVLLICKPEQLDVGWSAFLKDTK